MNSTKNIAIAATLSLLSLSQFGPANAADRAQTLKPVQGVSFHAGSKDAVAYFLSESRTCKLVVMSADKDGQPTKFEAAITGGESTRYELAEGKSLEFACQAHAQAITINSLATFATN